MTHAADGPLATIERALSDLGSKLLSKADFRALLRRNLDALAGTLASPEAEAARDELARLGDQYAATDDPTADEMKDFADEERLRQQMAAAVARLRASA